MPTDAAMNSLGWWDGFFEEQWERNHGRQQTRHFMERLVAGLPEVERAYLSSRSLSILDWGCALGDGVEVLGRHFPLADVSGLDFSPLAIAKARQEYPRYRFLRTESGAVPEAFDVVVTSNCLEHFDDPLGLLADHLTSCRRLYLALVPFDESPLCQYHCFSFREDTFPPRLGEFVRLAAQVIDVDLSLWPGKQLLAVYGSLDYLLDLRAQVPGGPDPVDSTRETAHLLDELRNQRQAADALAEDRGRLLEGVWHSRTYRFANRLNRALRWFLPRRDRGGRDHAA